ncbi:methyltransferase type 11 [Haloglomus irregulare]|jgi:ubiquinone/menaquinone biosynthesis C-methylase UbiE|uniref:Methyltransferase type 11 n=1 Tax=Haloglomus irregulare TaxID=2234134 RepID=A0A554MY16_9EURY|nr:class I SAM-dependent methyltransferase [Haloglomus irregulare]TSD10001.1 methyltransferase type 11 [Haloglomus irregulare]
MVEKRAVRQAYDEMARAYDAARTRDGRGLSVLESFLEFGPERVLDAGCGGGQPVLDRLDDAATAVGLDASGEQLRLAADRVPGAALAAGDMTRLPFADDTFDAVVAYWSLIHVPLAEHGTAIEAFARVLRPGGRVLVCEGREEWVGENPDWLDSGVGMAWEIAGLEATRAQLRAAGFTLAREWGVPDSLDDSEADAWVFLEGRLDGA